MNDDIRYSPFPSSSPSPTESASPLDAALVVSAEPSTAPLTEKLTEEGDRSLNAPSVSDAYLRSFAAIYDSACPVTKELNYIIFAEYGNYSDVSLYLFDEGSSVNANGSVSGSYTRYRIWSDYNGDSRYQVYSNRSSNLVFPSLGDTRSANVYSNVLGYRPNPYINEFSHIRANAVSSSMTFYVLAFSCLFALIMGVLGKCLRK